MNGALPTQQITVRFEEYERYDPMRDAETVCFMAITNIGTYHAELPRFGNVPLRRNRERFKQRAISTIEAGVMPCEIEMRDH